MRLPVEGPEERVHRTPKLVLDDRPGVVGGKRLDLVEQLEELQAVVGRKNVEPQRQRLPQLDPQAADLFEDRLHPLGAGRSRAAQHPGNEQMVKTDRESCQPRPNTLTIRRRPGVSARSGRPRLPTASSDRRSARFVVRPWGGSAKLRKTMTASSVAARRTARASRTR